MKKAQVEDKDIIIDADSDEISVKEEVVQADEITASLKARYAESDSVLFVDSEVSAREMIEADEAGKKLIFDITDFPEIPPMYLAKLSRRNRQAYSQDARYGLAAKRRMENGDSPYSDVKSAFEMSDPLGAAHIKNKFDITNKKKGYKYLFLDPNRSAPLLKAGYEVVKPGDQEDVACGEALDGKVVIRNSKGQVDHIVARVPQKDYDQHIKFHGNLSKKRLGMASEETKDKLKRYASRVKIYDESKLIK